MANSALTTKIATNSRTRSVNYADEPAKEFLDWIFARWSELSPAEQAAATMEVRPSAGLNHAMIGLRWIGEPRNG